MKCQLRPKERNCNHQCHFLVKAVTAHAQLSVPRLSLTVSRQNDIKQSQIAKVCMAEPSKFGATLNSGYFRFLSISHSVEALE